MTQQIRPVVGIFAIVLLVGIFSGVYIVDVGSSPQYNSCHDPSNDIPLQYGQTVSEDSATVNSTISRVNDSAIRISYRDLDDEQSDFGPSIPTWLYDMGVRVKSTEGFDVDHRNRGASLFWDSSFQEPSVTLTTDIPETTSGLDDAGAAIETEWAFVPLPPHSHPTNFTIDDDTSGVVGDQVLLLGEYSVYERNIGCHTIELYVPDAVETSEPPEEIANSIEDTAKELDVGWEYDTVRLFAVGDPARKGGQAFTHEGWIHMDSEFEPEISQSFRYPPHVEPVNIWVHEYVHTRQRWVTNGSVSSDAQWLTEALASYYMVSETARQGRMSSYNQTLYWERLNWSLSTNSEMILTRPGTYGQYGGDYTRGAYVIASLDAEIQAQTDGDKSFEDVFRQLNQEDEVTHQNFQEAVVTVAGEDMQPWLQQFVDDSDTPPPPPEPILSIYFESLVDSVADNLIEFVVVSISIVGAAVVTYRSAGSNDS